MIELAARGLMRRARSAALATAQANNGGWPYASLVTVACDCDGSPILLLSDLADHTKNLVADARASLLFEAASGKANPQTGPRVTVLGTVQKSDADRHRRRFLAHHPAAGFYAGFGDFYVYRMTIERAHYVAGFGRAHWVKGEDLVFDATAANAIAACEPDLLTSINQDHGDRPTLYATRLLGRQGDEWKAIAVDCEGCDLKRKNSFARLDFPRPVQDRETLEGVLIELTDQAKSDGL
jgi:hypothetical protein